MADSSPAETGGWERTAKDLFAGAVGGIAQVLLGMLVCFVLLEKMSFCFYKKNEDETDCPVK